MTPPDPGRRRSRNRRREPEARRSRSSRAARPGAGDRGAELRKGVAGAAKPLLSGLGEILAIGREMVAIPASIALGLAERLGLVILAAWRFARPILLAAAASARRWIAVGEREVTPARALAAVLAVAALLLAISQFLDYREVRAGVPAYAEVERVAPAPPVSGTAESAGSAHAYLLAPVALAVLALVVLAMLGRWRLARLIFLGGALTVAVAVFVDAPKGLDEGVTAIQFQGAEARLLGPFWVELAAGAVITVCGVLFALAVRPHRAGRRAARTARPRRRPASLGGSPVEGARS